jgi:Raf kinase inhibitor-like YbhB/YbcL family protein
MREIVSGRVSLAALVACVAVGACSGGADPPAAPSSEHSLEVTSPAFQNGDKIPVEFTCDGDDTSPPLNWSNVPNAREYVLTVLDPDADDYVHWIVAGIPSDVTSLERGMPPNDAVEGVNSTDESGYTGPCPPEGDDVHSYEFTVYALDESSSLEPNVTIDEVYSAIDGSVVARGTLTGSFGR